VSINLPDRPNLEQYRKQAKDLLKAVRAGDADARSRVERFLPESKQNGELQLADAQLAVARQCGFPSWPRMKRHIERLTRPKLSPELRDRFVKAVHDRDAATVDALLSEHAILREHINDPICEADAPPVVTARTHRPTVEVLLKHGADINARSRFWGRSVGVLDDVDDAEQRRFLVERGAIPEMTEFVEAVKGGDADRVRAILKQSAGVRARINEPLFSFGGPAIVVARDNRALLDVLLEYGADVNVRSDWEPGSFGVLDGARPETAKYLVDRGAYVDIHAAAALGDLARVRELVEAEPALVNARGGDGQRPLHFASTKEIIDYLLDHGAEIDARDIDHNGTAAQWAVNEPWKVRYLIERGAGVDVFMAAALGDIDLARRALREDPAAIHARIDQPGYALIAAGAANHIYLWQLRGGASPHEIALERGHKEVFEFLMNESPPRVRFLAAVTVPLESVARDALAAMPDGIGSLTAAEQGSIVEAADRRNLAALRLMLDLGFPIDAVSSEGITAVQRAALRGYADVVQFLAERGASLSATNGYGSNALGMVLWGSLNFRDRKGDYPATAETLIRAGSPRPDKLWGSDAVKEVLRQHGVT
jgi:hypothetical protein